jgi:hypothetical protein
VVSILSQSKGEQSHCIFGSSTINCGRESPYTSMLYTTVCSNCDHRLKATLTALLPQPADTLPFWQRRAAARRWPLSRALQCGLQLAEVENS